MDLFQLSLVLSVNLVLPSPRSLPLNFRLYVREMIFHVDLQPQQQIRTLQHKIPQVMPLQLNLNSQPLGLPPTLMVLLKLILVLSVNLVLPSPPSPHLHQTLLQSTPPLGPLLIPTAQLLLTLVLLVNPVPHSPLLLPLNLRLYVREMIFHVDLQPQQWIRTLQRNN